MKHLFSFSISFLLSLFFLAGCSSFIQDIQDIQNGQDIQDIQTISKPQTFTVTFDSNSDDESTDLGAMEPQLFTNGKPQPLSKNKYIRDTLAFQKTLLQHNPFTKMKSFLQLIKTLPFMPCGVTQTTKLYASFRSWMVLVMKTI